MWYSIFALHTMPVKFNRGRSKQTEAEANTPTTRAAAAAGPGAEAATSLPSDMFGKNPKHGSFFLIETVFVR